MNNIQHKVQGIIMKFKCYLTVGPYGRYHEAERFEVLSTLVLLIFSYFNSALVNFWIQGFYILAWDFSGPKPSEGQRYKLITCTNLPSLESVKL